MGNIANQRKLSAAIIGAAILAGIGEFNSTDATGELDVSGAGMTRILGFMATPIRATSSSQSANMGAVAATKYIDIKLPRIRGSVSAISITPGANVATSDVNYWTIGVINRGTDGLGVTVVVDATAAANSTKATGGTAFVAAEARALTLSATAADLAVTEEQVLRLTLTRVAAAASAGPVTVSLTVAGETIAVTTETEQISQQLGTCQRHTAHAGARPQSRHDQRCEAPGDDDCRGACRRLLDSGDRQ